MNKAVIEISNCRECKFLSQDRVYTGDSFETVFAWTCKKKNKLISDYVEWNEEKDMNIPEWCPIIKKP
jgi:hypothetical protein